MNPVSKYISEIGTEKRQNYMLLGKTTQTSLKENSSELFKQAWRDAEIVTKVTRNDVIGVIPNVQWRRGSNSFIPWSPQTTTVSNTYVYIPETGYVYLCVSDNTNNRTDNVGTTSTVKPTHTSGVQRYGDGFSWLPLYKINSSLQKFVTSTWIPVISLNDFEYSDYSGTTQYSKMFSFCDGGTGSTGNCAIYLNKNKEIPSSESIFETYSRGDLYTTIPNLSCSECYFLFEGENDDYISVFYGSQTPENTTETLSKLELIEDLISTSKISSNSQYVSLYNTWLNNGIEDGGIVSVFIDLSDYTSAELEVSESNPEVTIRSTSGSGASIRLLTFINEAGNYEINGIELLDHGQDYKDYLLEIDQNILLGESITSQDIISRIKINMDRADLLGLDPVSTLNCKDVMTYITFGTEEINSLSGDVLFPNEINFYSLVENPTIDTNGVEVTAGRSTGTKYTKEITSYATVLTGNTGFIGGPDLEKLEDEANWDGVGLLSDTGVLKSETTTIHNVDTVSSPGDVKIKLTGDIKLNSQGYTTIKLPDGTEIVVTDVETPDIKQFSGTPISAKIFTPRYTGLSGVNDSISIIITTPVV